MERGWREVSQTYEKPTRDSSAVRTVNVGAFRRCVPDGVLLSSYRRDNEALAVIGNLTERPQDIDLPGKSVRVEAGDVQLVRVNLEKLEGEAR